MHLPPFVRLLCCGLPALLPLLARAQAQSGQPLQDVTIIANRPVGNTGIPIDKFSGNVQTLSPEAASADRSDLTRLLSQALGSVHVNDTQGSPFGMDLNYRGFTASPVLGTPQGLSVFLDGMRINEPFGDAVSWDLLPALIVDKVTVIPGSNPVYGLNTLGGAIALGSKDGRSVQGTQGGITAGSFGRLSVDLEHGQHSDDDSLYLAGSAYNDNGWALYNPSRVRQLFGKYTRSGGAWEGALSVLYADNLLYGNQAVPQSMLSQAAQGYSHPDYTATRNLTVNAGGNLDADSSNSYAGNLYYRQVHRELLNSNVNQPVAGSVNGPGCATGSNCPAANLLGVTDESLWGTNLQWTNTDPLWDHNQTLAVGLNLELGTTTFSNQGQDAYLDSSNGLVPVDAYMPQANVGSHTARWGWFGTSTLDATEHLSLTASARYDDAYLALNGRSCVSGNLCDNTATVANGQLTDVGGEHHYRRFNPALGLTYLFAPHLIGFANYAEGMRTPSAIELACADPAVPCSGIPNAFGADPDLQAVVSRTIEIGVRGNLGARLGWRTAYYRTRLDNDIVFNQSSLNSGYFSNVGQTLREGVELALDGQWHAWEYGWDLDWINATYQSGFLVANPANSAPQTPVVAGDRIPGIPQWVLKARVALALDRDTQLKAALQAQDGSYARGDDNNADNHGMVPGFATLNVELRHNLGPHTHVFAGVNNLFDQRYANYGVLANNQISSGAAEQFLALGAPRTVFAGLQARF